MGQIERVVKYINTYGSISPMEAFKDLGITKLATVVSNMRYKLEKPYILYQTLEHRYNRFGEKVHYMRYWLDKDKYQDYMNTKDLFYEEV